MGKHFYVETYRLCIWPQPHPFPFASEIEVTGTPGDLSGRDLPCGSNVLTGLAAARDKLVSIRSIAMITSEIKQPTWPCLSIPQTASFRVLIMSVRAEMSPLRGNFHFDDVSSICLKFFFWSLFSFWLHSCLVCKSFHSRWLIAVFCYVCCPWISPWYLDLQFN